MTTYELVATCPEEIKDTLIQEIQTLGATDIVPVYKAVHFKVSPELFYKAHLVLACASNLFLVLKTFKLTPDQQQGSLLGYARKIPWTTIFAKNKTYRVDGSTEDRGRKALSSNQISKKVREGIEDHFMKKEGVLPNVELKEPDVVIVAHLRHGQMTISVNTSGKSLHKRGYRSVSSHEAPMKETLAAAILRRCGYDGTSAFLDPMCGSGTLPIEASFIALNKACNIHRKFAFEQLSILDRTMWRQVQDEVRLQKKETPAHKIYASDISSIYVKEAQATALRARVEKHIEFTTSSFFTLKKPEETGLIVTNLPYGARLNIDKLTEFYQQIGDHLKQNFTGWRACLLVSEDSPWKAIGLRPTRRIDLLNGSIKSKLLIFDLYAGSKRAPREQKDS